MLYDQINFHGNSQCYNHSINDVFYPFYNKFQSIKVKPGWTCTLYEQLMYGGIYKTFVDNDPIISDNVKSVSVFDKTRVVKKVIFIYFCVVLFQIHAILVTKLVFFHLFTTMSLITLALP